MVVHSCVKSCWTNEKTGNERQKLQAHSDKSLKKFESESLHAQGKPIIDRI